MNGSRKLPLAGIIIGGFLTLSPILGLIGTAIGMSHAFATLGNQGISDPRGLANSVSMVLIAPIAGITLFVIGIVVLAISIVIYAQGNRRVDPAAASNKRLVS